MAKVSYNSISYSKISLELDSLYELETLIDDLRELLDTTDRTSFSMTASLYDELLGVRHEALTQLRNSADTRLDQDKYKVCLDNSASNIVVERRISSEKDAA